MCKHFSLNIAFISILIIVCFSSKAQKVHEPKTTNADWSKQYQPFRIAGNLYYVGTYDLACYRIKLLDGHGIINLTNLEMIFFKY